MKIKLRTLALCIGSGVLAMAGTIAAAADAAAAEAAASFPDKAIKLIVPYPPGGGADIFARTLGEAITERIKHAVVIENKPGANGIIGTEAAARSPADGYTILLGNIGPNAINQALYKDLPYDCVKDFTAVTLIGYTTHVLAVNPKLPAHSVKELIALAKESPGKLTYASSGQGGSPHLAGEMFALTTGTKLVHVPYKGASPGNSDLVAGHVNLTFNTLPPLMSFIKSGQVRALAVTGSKRSPLLPDVPTIAESGVPGYDVTTWYGIFAPAKLPDAVTKKLNDLFKQVLSNPQVKAKLEGQGYEVATSTPAAFADFVKNDVQKWQRVVKEADVKIQ